MKTDNNGTVLYNRSELQAVFSQLQPREEYSLLHFNVKKFRYFLGRYDHETGEELLQQILKTFTKGLKKGQYLLYTGGDDFIFLIHEWRKKKIIDELIQIDVSLNFHIIILLSTENFCELSQNSSVVLYPVQTDFTTPNEIFCELSQFRSFIGNSDL